jgi:SAM domain (Sterile alpha motif)
LGAPRDDQPRPAEARNLLAPMYNWFTEGFDSPVLREAKALLEKLAACEIRDWLERIGLGQYVDVFEANDIEMD